MAASAQMSAAQMAQRAQAINFNRRQNILTGGVSIEDGLPKAPAIEMWQRLNPIIPSSPAPGTVITIPFRNVGLIKRFILELKATVTAGATTTQSLTPIGLPNLVSSVSLFDFGNSQRIMNVPAWGLHAIASAKRRRVFGASYVTDTPTGFANNNNRVMFAPATIAPNGSSEIDLQIEVPLCKNDIDLRGAIFADVNQAQGILQITLNPNMFVTSTGDPTSALYQSGGTDLATLSNVTVQCTQIYLDNLPRDDTGKITGLPRAALVPSLDLGTGYLITQTSSGLLVANQDNTYPFLNQRQYESLTFVYDNNGTLNVNGSDLNYVRLVSANVTMILDLDPKMLCLRERQVFGDDPPRGMHYLDFRHRPIDTDQTGNTQIIINPSSVLGAGSNALYVWEAYGVIGAVQNAGSLPSGGGM